ncbi:MAG: hypothetical protein ABF507_07520, partial [Bifidobacterium aquikefiri]|uniref:hypothetical protein n=1 Tax=Bifidobacterium aquikefiri TaxID=1653207 RepID=UPI0039E99862
MDSGEVRSLDSLRSLGMTEGKVPSCVFFFVFPNVSFVIPNVSLLVISSAFGHPVGSPFVILCVAFFVIPSVVEGSFLLDSGEV